MALCHETHRPKCLSPSSLAASVATDGRCELGNTENFDTAVTVGEVSVIVYVLFPVFSLIQLVQKARYARYIISAKTENIHLT